MEREESYIYPAIFREEEEEIEISFVDFPGVMTCCDGSSEGGAIRAAQELLALTIRDMEDAGKELPKPTPDLHDAIYIHVWMPYFRSLVREIYVKKTITIPQWLDILAKKEKVNFSAALVKELKQELGIGEKTGK